ncbi:hypothetical protein [Rummeliibacillus pycnus]|uniref:hypothetical protein n=1 Tax=Rummeliibacillus pycnus TaxID=101070 RepID=UPI0037CA8D75
MRKISFLIVSALTILATGCSSDSSSDSSSDDIETNIELAVQDAVEQNEKIDNVDWSWSKDDYHIIDNGDGTYDTSGQFSWHDKIYDFEMTFEDTDHNTLKLISYHIN